MDCDRKCRTRTFNLVIDNHILHMTLHILIYYKYLKNNTFCGVLDDKMCVKYKCSLVTKGLIN